MPTPVSRSSAPSPLSSSLSTPAAPSPKPPPSLVQRVLKSHVRDEQQHHTRSTKASYTRPSPSAPQPDDSPSTPRAQFEQQQDFISFDASPSPPPPTPSVAAGGPRSHQRKRARDDYDPTDHADDPSSLRLQSRERNRSTPWCDHPGVDWDRSRSAIDQLNREAHAFVHYVSPTPQEHELRLWTVELIRRTIAHAYPDASVECFGSVGTSLYLPGGDIDLVLLSPSLPSPPLKPSSSLLHRLASLLLTSGIAQPNSLVVIAKARVPIVKFVTRHGAFPVDLSVNQRGGVDAAVRVRSMLEEYAFREEGYVEPGLGVKGAAKAAAAAGGASSKGKADKGKGKGKRRAPSPGSSPSSASSDIIVVDPSDSEPEEGELPTPASSSSKAAASASTRRRDEQHPVDHGVARSLVLLVKAFLGQRGMNEVFTGGLGSYSIICLVISFLQLHPKIQTALINPNRNVGLLFVEFLELYGKHFNYDQAGITLRGRGGYFNKHDKGWYRPGQPYLLSIEDPNDPQNDVSGGSHAIIRVRQTLSGGYDVLTASLCARQSLLASSSSSSSSSTPGAAPRVLSASALPNADSDTRLDPSQRSLLGSIVGLGSAELASRAAHARLHGEGVLQGLLDREEGAFAPLTGKRLKRARREERAGERRERTVARLERKGEERERKAEKRRARKAREKAEREEEEDAAVEDAVVKAADLAPLADVAAHRRGAPVPADDDDDDNDDASGALFVVDTVGTSTRPPPAKKPRLSGAAPSSDDEDPADDADDSRYARAHVRAKPTASRPAAAGVVHVTDDSSASSGASDGGEGEDDDDDDDGGDVVLGGTGGDMVRPGGVSRDSTPGREAKARREREREKEEKNRRRNEYWAAKGVREESE